MRGGWGERNKGWDDSATLPLQTCKGKAEVKETDGGRVASAAR